MLRYIFIPGLALLGISFAIFMIYRGALEPSMPPIAFRPAAPPYEHYVAGEGLIESLNENTDLSVPFPDLLWEVYVKANDKVKKGQPLFKLDTRQQEADLCVAWYELKVAKTRYENEKFQFSYYQALADKSAVSKQAYTQAFYAKEQAKQEMLRSLANVNRIQTTIRRATVCAPSDGEILQENTRIGEFANVNPFDQIPLMIFGNTQKLQLRVNVAEEDAWRIIPESPAMAFVRGNTSISIPLKFNYIEPYIVPKQSFTGTDFEKVDTRVLQIVYTFEKGNYPVYVGQLLDVYVEAKPSKI